MGKGAAAGEFSDKSEIAARGGRRPSGLLNLAATATLFLASIAGAEESKAKTTNLGNDLVVRQLTKGSFLHISRRESDGVWANGLVVRLTAGLFLVDTAWNEDQANRLLDWGEAALGDHFVGAVVTHSHEDRSGGLKALQRRHVPIFASSLTVDLLRKRGDNLDPEGVVSPSEPALRDPRGFEIFYPGAAHTADNIVLYFPTDGLLFGGCMVRSMGATDLGFTKEADLMSWRTAITAVKERYPGALIVVPGHGELGDARALDKTLSLLAR